MYFWSFVLRPLSVWFNSEYSVSWKVIEENLSQSYTLQDLVYSNIPLKEAKSHLGPIISYLLRTCHTVMNHAKVDLKWHKHSPVFNIFSLLIGKKPFSFPLWRKKGVNVFNDLFDEDGLVLLVIYKLNMTYLVHHFSYICNWDLPWRHMLSLGGFHC